MRTVYHAGERAVQALAGVTEAADHVGRGVRDTVPAVAAAFLAERRMLVVGAADDTGRMWASLLTGPAGFLRARGDRTLDVAAAPVPGDPLADALSRPVPVGTIALEPATRRRMRLNGTAEPHGPGGLRIRAEQVYSNCPKYIQRRHLAPGTENTGATRPTAPAGAVRRSTALAPDQQSRLGSADTFFVATADGQGAADASHRGGNPGFVEVLGPDRLRWPEYPGNSMYMTLGNLEANPSAGLLFPDWSTGTVLQVSGTARLHWGTTPWVDFTVTRVVEIPDASPLRWTDPDFSPANPPVPVRPGSRAG